MDPTYMVIAALLVVAFGVGLGARVIAKAADTENLETSKVRFAAATFTGILLLIVFASVLYVAFPTGAGKEVFGAIVPAVTPIAGGVIGYLFGTRKNA
jgi:hypothetical protein